MTPPRVTLPDESWAADLARDDVRFDIWDVDSPLTLAPDDLAQVDVVVLPYIAPTRQLGEITQLPKLAAVQTLTAGYDGLIEQLPSGVQLCNAAGVHDTSTAEIALALVLAGQRGLGPAVLNQVAGRWEPQAWPSLADRKVMVVGIGGVGTAILHRLAPFEVELTRVGSRARSDELSDRYGDVHGIDELPALLPEHDVVILAVPLNDATHHLFDAAMLALMPDQALLCSVARGPVVDTAALTAELLSGRLRAALDVIDPEPLPGDHPIRQAPGLVLSPHVGGNSTAFRPRALAMLNRQFDRLVAGEPLGNVVHAG